MKLHIGDEQPHPDWKILNIQDGPNAGFIGDCNNLSQFADDSIEAIYASHVFEHLDHKSQLGHILSECWRVLEPGES
jgi:predicted SAM-dependent methyltransferase